MRNFVVVIALVVSLLANAVLFVGGVVYDAVDRVVDGVFGLTTAAVTQRKALTALKTSSTKQARALVASKAVVARQRGELSTLRAVVARQKRNLVAAHALTAKEQKKLAALRAAWSQQGRDLNDIKTALNRQGRARGWENRKIRSAVGTAAKRSRTRLLNGVARSILSAPAEALPYLGIAAVLGFTAWEISDYCATIRDMDEIQEAVGSGEPRGEPADCEERARHTLRELWRERERSIPDLPTWDALWDRPKGWLDRQWRSLFGS